MGTSSVQQDSSLGHFRKMLRQIRVMLSQRRSQPVQRWRCQVRLANREQHGLGLLMTGCLTLCRISSCSENRELHTTSV